MTCLMRTMRQPAFFPANGHTPAGSPPCHARRPLPVMPAGPSLSCPPAPPCHTRRSLCVMPAGPSLSCPPALPCHTRRSLPVIPAGPLPVIPAGPLPVMPAGPLPVMPAGPSLSYPQSPHCHSRSCKRESRVTFVSMFPFVIVTVIPGRPPCHSRSCKRESTERGKASGRRSRQCRPHSTPWRMGKGAGFRRNNGKNRRTP